MKKIKNAQETANLPQIQPPVMRFTPEVRPRTRAQKTELMEKITAYVQVHHGEKVELEAVAQHCGVSVSTITQMFQKNADFSFLELLTRCRLAAAEELIREGVPLEEIGKRVGYKSHSSFYRAFKIRYGISPREFRKKR